MAFRFYLISGLCLLVPSLASALIIPPLPAGMCPLNASVPEQAVVIDYLKNANAGSNDVITSFARCSELAAIAQRKAVGITHYGTVLQQSIGEDIGMDRVTYVRSVAQTYRAEPGLAQSALGSLQEMVATGTAGSGLDTPTQVELQNQGVLVANDAMVIIGMQQVNQFGAESVPVASTAAMTLVGGVPVSVNLYAPYSAAAFQESSAVLQPFVTKLIAANP